MGSTRLAPGFGLSREVIHAPAERHIIPAEVFDRPAERANAVTQPIPGVDGVVGAATEEDEAVGDPGRSLERGLAESTKPDRNGPRRLRHECGSVNPGE